MADLANTNTNTNANRRPRRWLRVLVVALVLAAIPLVIYRAEIIRLLRFADVFNPNHIAYNFQHMDEILTSRTVEAGGEVLEFERARASYALPEAFRYRDQPFETEAYLDEVGTTGLIIVEDDTILLERYERGHTAAGRHIAWSVSKSFVSALFGIAVGDGDIPDIMAPVTEYLPELEGSGYDGVPIKHVLQMSSGVGFNEDYGDPFSDINRMGPSMAIGSLLDFSATLERVREPGTLQHYVSVDTQVLGEILTRVTGRNLSDYASEKLWKPLGMEFDGVWLTDGAGMEWAFGGLNVSLRDFARLGWLYMNEGRRGGRQIVPAAWVHASVTPDAPHLMPGPKPDSNHQMGYGYQWWIPPVPDDDYMALGVYGQMIYVAPKDGLVIVKNGVDLDFQKNGFEHTQITLALWRAIAADLNGRE
jgi:CubicO group peptidase (beta-lactamase class C family)